MLLKVGWFKIVAVEGPLPLDNSSNTSALVTSVESRGAVSNSRSVTTALDLCSCCENRHKSTTYIVDLVVQTHHLMIGCLDHQQGLLVMHKAGPMADQKVGRKVVKMLAMK